MSPSNVAAWLIAFVPAHLVACRSECSSEVVGGSATQQAEVEASVATFMSLLDPELSVCVPKLKIVDALRGGGGGEYVFATRLVRLVSTDTRTVYHELCHAVQFQNDLPLEGPEWSLAPDVETAEANLDDLDREAFALACEYGPDIAFLMGDEPCDADEPGVSVFVDARRIFVGPDPSIVDLTLPIEFTRTATLGEGVESLAVSVMDSGILLTMDDAEVAIDPWSGAEVEPRGTPVLAEQYVIANDQMLSRLEFDAANGGTGFRRTFASDGRYTPVGCYEPTESVFYYGDGFWSAYVDGGAVVVGYYTVGRY